jgi:hypothetical protein
MMKDTGGTSESGYHKRNERDSAEGDHGILVSPHACSSSLGFERSGVRSPWPIAALVHWRHRGSFLVHWADIERFDERRIQLRPGFERASSELP